MKKRLLAAVGVVAALAMAAGAYAYFTSGGSGSGSASVGTSTSFVLHGTTADTLYPGTSSTVTFTVDNPGSGHQYLAKIHLDSIVACDQAFDVSGNCAAGHEITTCESKNDGSGANTGGGNFYMADVTVGEDHAPGTGESVTPTGNLVMNDLNSSQDSCKNANLKLVLSST